MRDAIVAFLKEQSQHACTPQEISDGLENPNTVLNFTEPVMRELAKLAKEGTMQVKNIGNRNNPYYAISP